VVLLLFAGSHSSVVAQTASETPPKVSSPQSEQPASNPDPNAVTPPKLIRFIEAVYPEEEKAKGITAQVDMLLTISTEGLVTAAQVAEPQNTVFEAPAVEAARRFRFEPATKGGKPIAAKIRYRYVFEIKAVEPPPKEEAASQPPPEGELSGRVVSRDEDKQVSGVEVIVTSADQKRALSTRTDNQGQFKFEHLLEGPYNVRVVAKGFQDLRAQEQVSANEATEVIYRLSAEADSEAFEAVARVEPPAREVTRRTLRSQVLTRVAGTRGDALRVVEMLPGVGRPPFLAGILLIRGSSPQDTQILYEGGIIPSLYHFGGLTSFMNSRLIDSIDFYPGNFSVRYGRQVGGILEVRGKDPGQNGFQGVVDLNLVDASFLVEGPIGKRGGFALAARRSYIDFFFDKLIPDDALSVVASPVYYDYQAIASYRVSSRDRLKISFFGSSDELRLVLKEPDDSDPLVRGNLDVATRFNNLQAQWKRKVGDNVDQEVQIAAGYQEQTFNLGDAFRLNLDVVNVSSRAEWQARVSSRVRLIGGLDAQVFPASVQYEGTQPRQDEGDPGAGLSGSESASNGALVNREVQLTIYRPAIYLESSVELTDGLTVVGGARLDWFSEINYFSVDPRTSVRYALTDNTTVKAGVGLFTQPPQIQEADDKLGNPDVSPMRAVHTSAGFEHQLTDVISFGVEGFYKRLFDRVVAVPSGLPPYFENNGTGNIYGAEVSGKADPKGRVFGFLSYTLMRSERKDRNEPTRLFDYDQTHILTASATYRLGRGWEVGGTFRLVSGNPYTPIVGSVYNVNSDLYQPIYGMINSARNPMFNRLDLRVEKMWRFEAWKLAAYLDVQNAYNATNREGVTYNYDYSRTSDIRGLPIIPSIGLRGEL